ncbi:MAG: multifunctional CCA tRNA nucleotidyl transferase/2'3'-cyclic phosphodiesterase/2'nucleotidase/phosphatase [Burkholderiales bacterium]
MQIYLVGGAVRDALLGLPVQDRDWLVVGATPEQMVAQGFTPVGRDFPVFLHPQTKEEYALARTERKTAPGYQGFAFHAAPEVTLEQDLARRDLTINSIAARAHSESAVGQFDIKNAELIDPFGGLADISARVLRHTTTAFREDPVRLLRLARFAARFTDFSIAPETQALAQAMVQAGEIDALVAERVWQEIARGLMETTPSRLLHVLHESGALWRLAPELAYAATAENAARFKHSLATVDAAAARNAPLPVRWAGWLVAQCGLDNSAAKHMEQLCTRWRVPADCRDLALWLAREHTVVQNAGELDASALVQLLDRSDVWRRPQRFELGLLASECLAQVAHGAGTMTPTGQRLQVALAAATSVSTASLAQQAQAQGLAGPAVAQHIQQARIQAVAQRLAEGN